jgi:DNA end-binding protein Ku
MRSKEYLVAIRPQEDILTLETMYFADEIRDPADATGYEPSGQQAKPRELDIAEQLIESMATDWDPENYHDTYRARVEELIESKRKGEEITAEAPAPRPSKVVDLTETLRRSVEEARGRRGEGTRSGSRAASASGGGGGGGGREADSAAGGRGRGRTRAARTDEGPSEEDLSGMAKSQLAALAAELGISGRSRMSRDELETAIREARHPRPKAVS